MRSADQEREALPVTSATKKGRCRLHGDASGSDGPPGERNGQYRHGERTKAAIAECRKFSALLKMLRAGDGSVAAAAVEKAKEIPARNVVTADNLASVVDACRIAVGSPGRGDGREVTPTVEEAMALGAVTDDLASVVNAQGDIPRS